MIEAKVEGAEDLRRVARALRRADRSDLSRQLTRAIRTAARPTVDDVRRTVRALPIQGFPYPGRKRAFHGFTPAPHALRESIAESVTTRISVSEDNPRVRFSAGSGLGERRTLPKRLDSVKGWRHPVMGNRVVWVRQVGKPWFGTTIRGHLGDFRREIGQALERVADQIRESA